MTTATRHVRPRPAVHDVPDARWDDLAWRCHARAVVERPHTLPRLAASLGLVSTYPLLALGVGILADGVTTTWPMRDAEGRVCGIRTRCADGAKRAITGSRSGCFCARDVLDGDGVLVVVEGASDTAAAIALGMDAIGRASALPSDRSDALAVRACAGRDVVVVPDRDPVGIDGARAFTASIAMRVRSLRWILPPRSAQDLRAAMVAGLGAAELRALIDTTSPLRATVEVRR